MIQNRNLFCRKPETDEEILKNRIKDEREHIQRNITTLMERQSELENVTKALFELKKQIQKNYSEYENKRKEIDSETKKEQRKINDLVKKIERLSTALQPSKYLFILRARVFFCLT